MNFISLDVNDVIYQDGAANYVIGTPNTAPEKTTTGAADPERHHRLHPLLHRRPQARR